MSLPEPIRSPLPVHRVTGEVLDVGEPPPYVAHAMESSPYVDHPASLTFRGWIVGGIIWAVVIVTVFGVAYLMDVVGSWG